MERFCSRYEEVNNLSFSEMAAALVDYAPGSVMFDDEVFWDVKGLFVGASEHRPDFPRGQGRIFDFIAHCPPEAGVP